MSQWQPGRSNSSSPWRGRWSQDWMRPSFIMELEGDTGNEGQHSIDHLLLRTLFDGDHITKNKQTNLTALWWESHICRQTWSAWLSGLNLTGLLIYIVHWEIFLGHLLLRKSKVVFKASSFLVLETTVRPVVGVSFREPNDQVSRITRQWRAGTCSLGNNLGVKSEYDYTAWCMHTAGELEAKTNPRAGENLSSSHRCPANFRYSLKK